MFRNFLAPKTVHNFWFRCLQLFDLFDLKQDGVIEFEEFVRSLSIFHPNTPEAEKLACKMAMTEFFFTSLAYMPVATIDSMFSVEVFLCKQHCQ